MRLLVMAVKLKKPILVTGVGLSILLWLGNSLSHQFMAMGEWGMMVTLALGAGFWLFYSKSPKVSFAPLSPLKREIVQEAIAQTEKLLTHLETEAPNRDLSPLKAEIAQLSAAFTRQDVKIAITGGKKVGKTSLKQALNPEKIADKLHIIETDSLFTETEITAKETALNCDLVLFLTNGDLTDSQWQIIQKYHNSHQRLVLLLNKGDQYIPEEREVILQQLKQRVKTIISEADVISITADPNPLKVRQYQADGSVQERMEIQTANLTVLETRLKEIIAQEKEQLILGTIWRQAKQLKQQAKAILNEVRRDRALPIIEQYQWIAAGAAFANPVSALDVLATVAINAQMVADLSAIYQQKFSLSQAQTISGTLGKLIVQLGLVELSTQAIGSLLKSNAITYIAGGAVQGISAAYLTRLAGLSLIEYWQELEVSITSVEGLNLEKLKQKLKQIFEQNQRTTFLRDFVKVALGHLSIV